MLVILNTYVSVQGYAPRSLLTLSTSTRLLPLIGPRPLLTTVVPPHVNGIPVLLHLYRERSRIVIGLQAGHQLLWRCQSGVHPPTLPFGRGAYTLVRHPTVFLDRCRHLRCPPAPYFRIHRLRGWNILVTSERCSTPVSLRPLGLPTLLSSGLTQTVHSPIREFTPVHLFTHVHWRSSSCRSGLPQAIQRHAVPFGA